MTLHILVVEDNADTRLLLGMFLEAEGHEVRTAATLRSALDELSSWHADVLLSDLGLPDGIGYELLEALRQRDVLPYALAMSGYGATADVATSLAAGFRHHLTKPIDIDELGRLIRAADAEIDARSAERSV